jgi:D-glycero-alpha-D-manno-heptose-7-phosphate kinase
LIIVRTPLRVSFFGGGTDHPAWFEQHGPGAVVSTAINKFVYIQLRPTPAIFPFKYRVVWRQVEQVLTKEEIEHPVVRAVLQHYGQDEKHGYEVVYNADLPARAGLASSSAFTVAMLHAFNSNRGRYMSPRDLASEAIFVEQKLLNEAVGCQDQIAVAFGGLNRIDFGKAGAFDVRPVDVQPERRDRLEGSLMLFFTSFTRSAGKIEEQKLENFAKKAADLNRMYDMVGEGVQLLENPATDLDDFGRLLDEAWQRKRGLATAVSNNDIDDAYARAIKAGALGGKLLGAGGGGFLLFYVPNDRQEAVVRALEPYRHVPFRMERGGSRVALHDPDLTSNYETVYPDPHQNEAKPKRKAA